MPRSAAIALTLVPTMTDPTVATAADEVSALVARARDGDLAAFQGLYERTAGRVFALCIRMTGDRERARELAHDAFVRAWERLTTFRGEAQFDTWMHRIAVNVVLEARRSERRREARVALIEDEDSAHQLENVGASAPADVLARVDLERAIAALPPNARQVFVLHDVEGFQHEEIAERMNLAPGTVRAHLHRARKLLMRMLNR